MKVRWTEARSDVSAARNGRHLTMFSKKVDPKGTSHMVG